MLAPRHAAPFCRVTIFGVDPFDDIAPCPGLSSLVNSESNVRVGLEPLAESHAAELFPALSHRAIYDYFAGEPPASVAALATRFRRLESRMSPDGSQRWLNWVIRLHGSRECIGYVQATVHAGSTADYAFVLAPAFWGCGLAHEASTIALSLLFADYGISSLFATVDQRNLRSSALLLRLGFQRVPPTSYPHGAVDATDEVFRLDRDPLTPQTAARTGRRPSS
jgi:RimJ/RimL family protein N-acetyltransferase